MKVLLQRVARAAVDVGGERIAEIGPGVLLLVGVVPGDSEREVAWLVDKVAGLRIFPGAQAGGKAMDRSLVDIGGSALVVSQFTLAADTSRGRRPSFTGAAPPALAEPLYLAFAERLGTLVPTRTGRFGADMAVSLVNDGPVTLLLERSPEVVS